jgi:hypothetical protein
MALRPARLLEENNVRFIQCLNSDLENLCKENQNKKHETHLYSFGNGRNVLCCYFANMFNN